MELNLRVDVSTDKLGAYVQLVRLDDTFTCTADELEQFLHQSGVKYGILPDVLAQIANEPAAYYMKQTLVAQGQPAVAGEDGRLVFAINMSGKRGPAENEDGKVDLKEIVQLLNVKRGQLIAECVSPAEGKPGKAVTGEPIPGRRGKEAKIKAGKNVVLNAEKTALYAAMDGLVTKTENDKINVFPVYEVNGDVDYRTGNIDFVGTVVVRGNVLTGFKIRAAGDIRIIGGVEGAELESDGSIEITSGIMAGGKGLVKAGWNVRSSFIQDANVIAGEDVIVNQSIMHSNVRAGRTVLCTGAKGLIVGGIIQAGECVSARVIGNSMSTATAVEVGVLPELRSELLELRKTIKQLSDSLNKTEKALSLLDQLAAAGQLGADKMEMRMKFGTTKKQMLQELEESKDRMLVIEKSVEESNNAKVDVINTVFGGTKIVIGRSTRFVKEPVKRISFRCSEGDIAMIAYR
ncbi:polymerase [Paenibacillus beijingensis]|uniref:Polymerase n=2 Tax=Paenibacillus beijingensis TaxID=1126833 RepID=A0A0D5NSB6_9BACL|nr:polymerase [Paenibacillus beijingensis]